MAPQGGKKKGKTHIRNGATKSNYIDNLADSAAGIKQVDAFNDPKWTPEEDTTMTKDVGGHLEQDFSLPGQRPKQVQRAPPPQRPRQAPPKQQAPPKKQATPKEEPKSAKFMKKALMIGKKFKQGKITKEQSLSMRRKLTSMIDTEIKDIKHKMEVIETKFLNDQVEMNKYDHWNAKLSKELKQLKLAREKIAPKGC